MTWPDGSVYVGQYKNGGWSNATLGEMVTVDGRRLKGLFGEGALKDGVIYDSAGNVLQRRGQGTVYDLTAYRP
jgi:hypothetical protein